MNKTYFNKGKDDAKRGLPKRFSGWKKLSLSPKEQDAARSYCEGYESEKDK